MRTEADGTVMEALDPQTMVAVAGEPSLQPVADEAATRLRSHWASCEKRAELLRRARLAHRNPRGDQRPGRR